MDIVDFSTFTLESATAVLIVCLAVELLRMRIATRSGCCGEHISITTESIGAENPVNNLSDSMV